MSVRLVCADVLVARLQGHCWGKNVQPMLDCLPLPDERFDTIILSDLVRFETEPHLCSAELTV
jgi:hypothetical protein